MISTDKIVKQPNINPIHLIEALQINDWYSSSHKSFYFAGYLTLVGSKRTCRDVIKRKHFNLDGDAVINKIYIYNKFIDCIIDDKYFAIEVLQAVT